MKKTLGSLFITFLFFTSFLHASDGVLDSSFNGSGRVNTSFLGAADTAFDIAVNTDNTLLVLGSVTDGNTTQGIGIAKYDSNGSLVTDFNGTGKLVSTVATAARRIALQNDKKFVVAGLLANKMLLARFDENGSLDSSFDGNGTMTPNFAETSAAANDLLVKYDSVQGKHFITVVGEVSVSVYPDFAVMKVEENGTGVSSFGSNGQVTHDFSGMGDRANAVKELSDGNLIVAGSTDDVNGTSHFAAIKLDINGSVVNSVITDFGANTIVEDIVIFPDDSILLVGSYDTNTTDIALAKYDSNLSLDTGFGTGGKLTLDINASIEQATRAQLLDNKRVLIGGTLTNSNQGFMLLLEEDGSHVTSFGSNGVVVDVMETSTTVLEHNNAIFMVGAKAGGFSTAKYIYKTPTLMLKAHGGVVQFDTNTAFLDMPQADINATAFTIEWLMKPQNSDKRAVLAAKNGWGSFVFSADSTGAITVGTDQNNSLTSTNLPANTLSEGVWQHFAFSFNAGVGKFYKDGVLLASKSGMSTPASWGGLSTGYTNFLGLSDAAFKGLLDEVRVWDKERLSYEIAQDRDKQLDANTSNLIAYYNFDEGLGLSANNLINTSEHASLEGNVTRLNFLDTLVSFDGNSSYAQVNDTSALDVSSAMSFSAWVNLSNLTADSYLVSKYGNTGDKAYSLFVDSSGQLHFLLSFDGSTQTTLSSSQMLNAKQWYYVSAVYDGFEMKLYINGVQDASTSALGFINNSANPLYLAKHFDNSGYLDGFMAEVKLYNKALSVVDIKEDMRESVHETDSTLVGYWSLRDESTSVAKDRSTHSLHALLSNVSVSEHAPALYGNKLYTSKGFSSLEKLQLRFESANSFALSTANTKVSDFNTSQGSFFYSAQGSEVFNVEANTTSNSYSQSINVITNTVVTDVVLKDVNLSANNINNIYVVSESSVFTNINGSSSLSTGDHNLSVAITGELHAIKVVIDNKDWWYNFNDKKFYEAQGSTNSFQGDLSSGITLNFLNAQFVSSGSENSDALHSIDKEQIVFMYDKNDILQTMASSTFYNNKRLSFITFDTNGSRLAQSYIRYDSAGARASKKDYNNTNLSGHNFVLRQLNTYKDQSLSANFLHSQTQDTNLDGTNDISRTYTYALEGGLISIGEEYREDNTTRYVRYTRDANGNIVLFEKSSSNDFSSLTYKEEYSYDVNNSLVQHKKYDNGVSLSFQQNYSYNPDGSLSAVSLDTNGDSVIDENRSYFDANDFDFFKESSISVYNSASAIDSSVLTTKELFEVEINDHDGSVEISKVVLSSTSFKFYDYNKTTKRYEHLDEDLNLSINSNIISLGDSQYEVKYLQDTNASSLNLSAFKLFTGTAATASKLLIKITKNNVELRETVQDYENNNSTFSSLDAFISRYSDANSSSYFNSRKGYESVGLAFNTSYTSGDTNGTLREIKDGAEVNASVGTWSIQTFSDVNGSVLTISPTDTKSYDTDVVYQLSGGIVKRGHIDKENSVMEGVWFDRVSHDTFLTAVYKNQTGCEAGGYAWSNNQCSYDDSNGTVSINLNNVNLSEHNISTVYLVDNNASSTILVDNTINNGSNTNNIIVTYGNAYSIKVVLVDGSQWWYNFADAKLYASNDGSNNFKKLIANSTGNISVDASASNWQSNNYSNNFFYKGLEKLRIEKAISQAVFDAYSENNISAILDVEFNTLSTDLRSSVHYSLSKLISSTATLVSDSYKNEYNISANNTTTSFQSSDNNESFVRINNDLNILIDANNTTAKLVQSYNYETLKTLYEAEGLYFNFDTSAAAYKIALHTTNEHIDFNNSEDVNESGTTYSSINAYLNAKSDENNTFEDGYYFLDTNASSGSLSRVTYVVNEQDSYVKESIQNNAGSWQIDGSILKVDLNTSIDNIAFQEIGGILKKREYPVVGYREFVLLNNVARDNIIDSIKPVSKTKSLNKLSSNLMNEVFSATKVTTDSIDLNNEFNTTAGSVFLSSEVTSSNLSTDNNVSRLVYKHTTSTLYDGIQTTLTPTFTNAAHAQAGLRAFLYNDGVNDIVASLIVKPDRITAEVNNETNSTNLYRVTLMQKSSGFSGKNLELSLWKSHHGINFKVIDTNESVVNAYQIKTLENATVSKDYIAYFTQVKDEAAKVSAEFNATVGVVEEVFDIDTVNAVNVQEDAPTYTINLARYFYGKTPTYSVNTSNANVNVSQNANVLSITPVANAYGSTQIDINVGSVTESFNFVIANVNDAPTISAIADTTLSFVAQGEDDNLTSFPFSVYDADGDTLNMTATFSSNHYVSVADLNATINQANYNTNTLVLKPNKGAYGGVIVTLNAGDAQVSASTSFVVIVEAPKQMQTTNYALKRGWNLISLPSTTSLNHDGIEAFLGNPQIEAVYKYDLFWRKWQSGVNNLDFSNLGASEGFWVKVAEDVTVSINTNMGVNDENNTKNINTVGWHLIGMNADKSVGEIKQLINEQNTSRSLDELWIYDANAGEWKSYLDSNPSNGSLDANSTIQKENGIWINIK